MALIIDLHDIDDKFLRAKLNRFKDSFFERTGTVPQYVVQTPGRVNIIGDHIDYHGFAVLPMAIEKSIWLGCSFTETNPCDGISNLRILNQDREKFPDLNCDHSFSHGSKLDQAHKWYYYVLCGYHGVLVEKLLSVPANQTLEHAKTELIHETDALKSRLLGLTSINMLIQSDLPPASGLSSSSALVCASAVATCLMLPKTINNPIDRSKLAEDCSKFEHLVGTHGGGMDQAVIMTANHGFAKCVEFMPEFLCKDVELPKDVVWLVSHCGSEYPKAATTGYNSRVLETKLGAAIIVKSVIPELATSDIVLDKTITLGKVQRELGLDNPSAVELLRKVLKNKTLSLNEISIALSMTEDEVINKFGTTRAFLDENFLDEFSLQKRCEHVFEEAERVNKFREICRSGRDLVELGRLMIESHFSLRDKYDCSHPALDKLVEISLEAGALGARLTGAGWGGCIVTLVKSENSQEVQDKLAAVSRFTFRTEPQSGCTIIKF